MSCIHIESIKIYNFKSFKGEHIISPLDPHFNVIVGSNGSGKSNIIDSILFVLGFRAKRMRQRVNTDLIYCGSKRESECYVELCFRKGSQVTSLMRQIKNGKSSYFINKKDATFQEVTEFVTSENIDIENNRFAILQGEIEGISLMKPKNDGMLEYLEDITGTMQYNEKINHLSTELEKESDNFEVVASSYKFTEKELQYVKNIKEKDEETLGLYLNKLKLKSEYNHILSSKLSKDSLNLDKEAKNAKKALKELESKNKEAKEKMGELEGNLCQHKTKVNKKENEFKKLQKSFTECDMKRMLVEDKRKKYQSSIEETKGELKNKTEKNKLSEKEKLMLEKEIKDNEDEIKVMNVKIKKLRTEILKSENKGRKGKYLKEIEKIEKDLFKMTEERNKLCEQIQEYENLSERKKNLLGKKDRFEGKKQFEKDFQQVNNEIEAKYKKLSEINEDIKETELELSKQTNKLDEVQKHDNANIKETQINKLFKNIDGYIGRLGSLGTVEDELVVAISAVAKNALNNIVVNNTETAEECIRILKRNNIERTTFIVLDRLREFKLDNKFNYLMNHIKCEDMHKKAFYFVFTDTILCDNMAEAKKIGMGKISRKVVTKDGKIIDKSGLMSGGGEFIKVTKMTGTKRNDLELTINKLKKALSAMVEEKRKGLETIAGIKNKRNELERERESIDIDAINTELKELDKKILHKKNKEGKEKITLNEKLSAELESKLDDLNSKLDNDDDIETKRKKGEISILFENLSLFESRNKDLIVKLNNIILYDVAKLEGNLKIYEAEIKKLKIPDNFDELKVQIEKDENIMKDLIKTSDSISGQISQLRNKIGDDLTKEIELKNTMDDNTHRISMNKSKIGTLRDVNTQLDVEFNKYRSYHTKNIVISYEDLEDVDNIEDLLESKSRELKKFEFIEGSALNMKIFNEFDQKKKEYEESKKNYDEFKNRMDNNRKELETLISRKHDEFMAGLNAINKNLKEIYQLLTFGGNAELEMVDPIDPFAEGISLSVMPPKKSWKNVSMLSGGEKTLSSLALVFALHIYKPSPFYVMDEIDAALDFKNVSIISNYILEKTKDSQFLIVSLRDNMFELSDTLLGVYKNDGLSKAMMFDIKEMKKKIIQ